MGQQGRVVAGQGRVASRQGRSGPSGVWVAVGMLSVVFVVLLAVTVTLLVVRGSTTAGDEPRTTPTSAGAGERGATPEPDDLVLATGAEPTGFRSPSGNITCVIGPAGTGSAAECEIAEVSWSVPRPDDCELEWGGGGAGAGRVTVAADGNEAAVVCGDAALVGPQPPTVLPYGQAVWFADELVCRSAESGMRCESLRSGSGFAVSRAALDLF